ncbi:MAG: TIGR00282 family metallophosphoesterase [Gammaproteobacteria bacterium]|nr:TIGR00282 family metallophosphoesterase [Gammaproteobacteria bacterium]
MNLLFIGDVMGAPGYRALAAHLPSLRQQLTLDLIVANGENIAGGNGITGDTARDLFALGIDVITNGNHAWDKKEALDYIVREPRLLRPHNFPPTTPGSGWYVTDTRAGRVGVLNVMGTLFMQPTLACPFHAVDEALARKPDDVKIVLVDIHAETTSEKTAMGWYLDGRVSAVVGTHTHIPTADERVLPRGTAYITDVGMAGCYDSVIGLDIAKALKRLMYKLPERFDLAEGKGRLCGVVIDIDEPTGKSRSIRRLALDEP